MVPNLPTPWTHPFTAALAQAVPLWLTAAAILALSLLLRSQLLAAMAHLIERQAARGRLRPVDAILMWTPPIVSPAHLLAATVGTLLGLLVLLNRVVPLYVALALSGPALALLLWLLLRIGEARYQRLLEAALPGAVSRLAAQLKGGAGFQPALARIVTDLPAGPLRTEWSWLMAQIGAPLTTGLRATPALVVSALAAQTPSPRHRMLLGHLEVALGQTHDVQVARLIAAGEALYEADRQRSAALTELAQMRASGVLVGCVTCGLSLFLMATQAERVRAAYSSPLGIPMALLVAVAIAAPLIGGILLARIDDVDY